MLLPQDVEAQIDAFLSTAHPSCNASQVRALGGVCWQQNQSRAALSTFLAAYRYWVTQRDAFPSLLQDSSPLSSQQFLSVKPAAQGTTLRELASLVVVKLNGGLGTSMGCSGPKSLVCIAPNTRFIDWIIEQKEYADAQAGCCVPFYTMNSAATAAAMKQAAVSLPSFLQWQFPRVDCNTGGVVMRNEVPSVAPAGHGNVYQAMYDAGLLYQWHNQGKTYLFISNSDNCGAVVDADILHAVSAGAYDAVMEVTSRTPLDKKGGIVVEKNQAPYLIERSQCTPDQYALTEDIAQFSVFNTNSMWVRIAAIIQAIEAGTFQLPVLLNKKTVAGQSCVQFESAMGSALPLFQRTACVQVGRERFFPVKTTSDLLLLRSDLVTKETTGRLRYTRPVTQLPIITLSDTYWNVAAFNEAFEQVPSLKHVTQLTLRGPFIFKAGVVLKGDCLLENSGVKPVVLAHCTLEGAHRYDV